VRERLRIMYKEHSFELESRVGVGTQVRIMIPMEEL